jgi:hypothetical protein
MHHYNPDTLFSRFRRLANVSTEIKDRQLQAKSKTNGKGRQQDDILRQMQRRNGVILLPVRSIHVHDRLHIPQLHQYFEGNVP